MIGVKKQKSDLGKKLNNKTSYQYSVLSEGVGTCLNDNRSNVGNPTESPLSGKLGKSVIISPSESTQKFPKVTSSPSELAQKTAPIGFMQTFSNRLAMEKPKNP